MKHKKHITLLLILMATLSFGQAQLLKKYDFDKGGYYLIGVRSESDPNTLADSLGEFYTDDLKILNAIKKEWTFTKPSPQYACGYHYEVIICKGGLELESFSINLNCNEIATDQGYFYFDAQQLRMFKDSFKKPFRKIEKFTVLAEARNYRNSILKDQGLILTPTPIWTKYEGSFKFNYDCKNCFDNEDKLLKRLTEEIKLKYAGEPFELDGRGGSNSELFVEVRSNKSLSDKFSSYKRDLEFDDWKPYHLWFYTYWSIVGK
jgi:hypothetical protein